MRKKTGPFRFLFRIVGGLILAIILLVSAVFITVGYTDFGANFAVREITKRIASPNLSIRVGEVSAPLTGHFTVSSVEVSDKNGPYVTVEDVDLRWSPMALFSRRFSAASLSAASIDLKRLPESDATEKEQASTGGGFSLPIEIAIDRFDFPKIDIGEPVLGEAYPLSATGRAEALSSRISAVLDAQHRARPSTYVSADVDYAPNENRLDIKAEVNEPQGGLVATLMKLPGAPALNIQVNGGGPLNDWSGNIDAKLSGNDLGSVTVTHALNQSGERTVTVSGSGQFAPLAPEPFNALVEGTTDLDIAVSMAQTGRISVRKGSVSTGSFKLSASGTYDPKGQNDLRANLSGIDGAAIPFSWPLGDDVLDLAIGGADVTLSGSADNASLSANISLNRLAAPQATISGIALTAAGQGINLQNQTGQIETALSVDDVTLANASIAPFVQAPLTLEAPVMLKAGSISVDPLTLESGSIGATINAAFDKSAKTVDGHAKIFVLADALPVAASDMIDGVTRLESGFSATMDGNLKLSGLEIENNLLKADGNVALNDGTLDASLKTAFKDLSRLAGQLAGKATLSVSANGAVASPDIRADLQTDTLQISGETLKDFSLALNGKADPAAPSGTLMATGTYANAPLSLAANVASSNGMINIGDIEGKVGNNQLAGDVTLNGKFLPAGQVSFDFPDLKLLAGLAGQSASGGISGKVALDNASDKLGLSLTAKSDSVTFSDITARAINADIAVSDAAALKASGSINVGSVAVAGKTVSDIALTASNAGSSTDFNLSAKYENDPVEIAASVVRGQTMEIDLTKLEGSPMALALSLAEPGRIVVSNGTADIRKLTIGIGGGTVSASGTAGQNLNLRIAINGVSPSIANTFVANLGAQGAISGTVNVSGQGSNPVVDYDIRLTNGNVAQSRNLGVPPITLATTGRYAQNRVTTNTTVTNARGLNLTASGSVGLSGNMPLDLAVRGDFPLTVLSAMAADAGFAVSGSANADLTIGGQASNPSFGGGINLNIRSVTDLRRNISLNNINGRLSFSGNRILTENIKGNLSGGGTIAVDGTIDLTGQFPASLKLTADRAVITDGSLLSTTADGNLSLDGPLLGEPTISGRISLSRTAITIPERLPASISEIRIVHEDASSAVLRQAEAIQPGEATEARTAFKLDITVSAPNAIFVRGRGVDAELGGEVGITGTTLNPIVSGGFELVRGRLSILNRRLDFESGRITFGGSLVPIIDLRAVTSADSTNITITLQGVATNPQVELSSSPALPQDEILARLLFNRPSANLSALQIAQLADAVIQLTGGTEQSLFNSLRDVLGFDNLDLSTDESGNTSVSVGKYLNENTYLEIEQSQDTGTQANVNIDIGRNFILKGSAGSRGEASGGIFYEREY